MKYLIKNIKEDWDARTASITLTSVKDNKSDTFECSMDTINQIAENLGYVENDGDCLPYWLIGQEINMDIYEIFSGD